MPRLLPLIAVVLLAGCGQKGPLYLPKAEPAPAQVPAAPQDDQEKKAAASPAAQP